MKRLIPQDILAILPWRWVVLGVDILVLRQPVGLRLSASVAHLREVRRLAKELAMLLAGTIKARSQGHGFGCEFIMQWPLENRP